MTTFSLSQGFLDQPLSSGTGPRIHAVLGGTLAGPAVANAQRPTRLPMNEVCVVGGGHAVHLVEIGLVGVWILRNGISLAIDCSLGNVGITGPSRVSNPPPFHFQRVSSPVFLTSRSAVEPQPRDVLKQKALHLLSLCICVGETTPS